MKAKIEKQDWVITLTMSTEEYKLLFEGIGSTSLPSRIESGMTRDQAVAVGDFWGVLAKHKEE